MAERGLINRASCRLLDGSNATPPETSPPPHLQVPA